MAKYNLKHWHHVNGHVYKRELGREYRRVKYRGEGLVYKSLKSVTRAKLQADIEISIDAQALIDLMLFRVSQTKGGKASALDGIIVARRTSPEKVLEEEVSEHQLGHNEVEVA